MNSGVLAKFQIGLAALLALLVLVGVGAFAFFYRLGLNDAQILANFPAAYQAYDLAEADFSTAVLGNPPTGEAETSEAELRAETALADLQSKASARLSSLTLHDGELMQTMLSIADAAGQEVETLKAYQQSPAERDQLAQSLADLTSQRQAYYTQFRLLAGGR